MRANPGDDSRLLVELTELVRELSARRITQASVLLDARSHAFAQANTLVADSQLPEAVQLRVLAEFASATDHMLRLRWHDLFALALPNKLSFQDVNRG